MCDHDAQIDLFEKSIIYKAKQSNQNSNQAHLSSCFNNISLICPKTDNISIALLFKFHVFQSSSEDWSSSK